MAVVDLQFVPRSLRLDDEPVTLSQNAWALLAYLAVSPLPVHREGSLARALAPAQAPEGDMDALRAALDEIDRHPALAPLLTRQRGESGEGDALSLSSAATFHTPLTRLLELEDRALSPSLSVARLRQIISALTSAAHATLPKSEKGETWIDEAHPRLDALARRALERAVGMSAEESAFATGLLLDAQRENFLGLDAQGRPRPRLLLGRDDEIAELRELLARPGLSLLTLVGELGIGKTALALELLEMLPAPLSTRKVYTVRLRGVGSYPLLMDQLADGLRLGIVSSLPAVVDREDLVIGRATGSVLLLDNAEGLDDRAVRLLSRLLKQSGAKVLCTSRRALGIEGETTFQVEGLPIPTLADARIAEEGGAASLPSRFASAALYLDWRLQAKGLCAPSAHSLQKALSNTRGNPEEIHRAALDPGWGGDAPQSLADALQALSGEDRALLRGLALFHSAFSPRSAEIASGIEDAHARLERLSEIGLVHSLQSLQGRLYRLPSLVRETLDGEGEGKEASPYLRFAEALLVEAGEIDPKDAPATLRLLIDGEAAIAALLKIEQGERAVALASSLTPLACRAGMLGQIERLLRIVGKAPLSPFGRAEIDDALGRVLFSSGDFSGSARHTEAALRFWREIADAGKVARASGNLGIAYQKLGNLRQAAASLEESIEGFKAVRDLPRLGAAWANLAGVALDLHEPKRAKVAHLEGAKIARKLGSDSEAVRLLGVVEACLLGGERREALTRLQGLASSLPEARSDRRARALLLYSLAVGECGALAAEAYQTGRAWHLARKASSSLCYSIERRLDSEFGNLDAASIALGAEIDVDTLFEAIFTVRD